MKNIPGTVSFFIQAFLLLNSRVEVPARSVIMPGLPCRYSTLVGGGVCASHWISAEITIMLQQVLKLLPATLPGIVSEECFVEYATLILEASTGSWHGSLTDSDPNFPVSLQGRSLR